MAKGGKGNSSKESEDDLTPAEGKSTNKNSTKTDDKRRYSRRLHGNGVEIQPAIDAESNKKKAAKKLPKVNQPEGSMASGKSKEGEKSPEQLRSDENQQIETENSDKQPDRSTDADGGPKKHSSISESAAETQNNNKQKEIPIVEPIIDESEQEVDRRKFKSRSRTRSPVTETTRRGGKGKGHGKGQSNWRSKARNISDSESAESSSDNSDSGQSVSTSSEEERGRSRKRSSTKERKHKQRYGCRKGTRD